MEVGGVGGGRTKKAWKTVRPTCRKRRAPAQIRLLVMLLWLKYSPVSRICFIQII